MSHSLDSTFSTQPRAFSYVVKISQVNDLLQDFNILILDISDEVLDPSPVVSNTRKFDPKKELLKVSSFRRLSSAPTLSPNTTKTVHVIPALVPSSRSRPKPTPHIRQPNFRRNSLER